MKAPACQQSDSRAFTLVELLVMVAILSILAALLLPALSASRQAALRIVCMGRQKQLATAFFLYATDHKGFCFFANGRHVEIRGCWATPALPSTVPWNKYHTAVNAYAEDYLGGYVNSTTSTSHVLRCPANADFLDMGGGWKQHHSTYIYMGQAGFVETHNEAQIDALGALPFHTPYRLQIIERISGKYGFPFLLFVDRVDYRRRWTDTTAFPAQDSNHGKLANLQGGNAAYADGHCKWHAADYLNTGTMMKPRGWQLVHNDAWDAFLIPNDCTAWAKYGNRTRFYYGTKQKSGVPYYDPLSD